MAYKLHFRGLLGKKQRILCGANSSYYTHKIEKVTCKKCIDIYKKKENK